MLANCGLQGGMILISSLYLLDGNVPPPPIAAMYSTGSDVGSGRPPTVDGVPGAVETKQWGVSS